MRNAPTKHGKILKSHNFILALLQSSSTSDMSEISSLHAPNIEGCHTCLRRLHHTRTRFHTPNNNTMQVSQELPMFDVWVKWDEPNPGIKTILSTLKPKWSLDRLSIKVDSSHKLLLTVRIVVLCLHNFKQFTQGRTF